MIAGVDGGKSRNGALAQGHSAAYAPEIDRKKGRKERWEKAMLNIMQQLR